MRTAPKLPRPLSPGERPAAGPTWPDEYIEHWATVYLDPQTNRLLRARRVRFETFLYAPVEILYAARKWSEFWPPAGLLPAQRSVQEREDARASIEVLAETALDYVAAESHCANGRVVEKLRHHAFPRSRAMFGPGRS